MIRFLKSKFNKKEKIKFAIYKTSGGKEYLVTVSLMGGGLLILRSERNLENAEKVESYIKKLVKKELKNIYVVD